MKPKPVRTSAIYGFSYSVLSIDLNQEGILFGGKAVALMDIIAAKVAKKHRPGRWVTARIDHINFLCPVFEDETILFFASINKTWSSSCEIGVKMLVRRPQVAAPEHIASAYFTFVALDSKGKPIIIPQIIPVTLEEKRRFTDAEERRAKRLTERKKSPD